MSGGNESAVIAMVAEALRSRAAQHKGFPMEINQEFTNRIKEKFPWLQVQQIKRGEQLRITHYIPKEPSVVSGMPHTAFEHFYPCGHFIEVHSREDLLTKVENKVLALIGDLEMLAHVADALNDPDQLREAIGDSRFYLAFTDLSYCASDDGDEYERYATTISLMRVQNGEGFTLGVNGRVEKMGVPEPTAEELAALQKQVDEANRAEKVTRLADLDKDLLGKIKIKIEASSLLCNLSASSVTGASTLRLAADALLRLADTIGHPDVLADTYVKITPAGIEYADTQGSVIEVADFQNLEISATDKLEQRSIIHLTVGDNDWQPTPEEMHQIVALFRDAKAVDGAVVVTTDMVKVHPSTRASILAVGPDTTIKIDPSK